MFVFQYFKLFYFSNYSTLTGSLKRISSSVSVFNDGTNVDTWWFLKYGSNASSVITLSIAIITTIISDGFVVRGMLVGKGETFANVVFAVIFVGAYYFSGFGFAEIVENFYPINGFLGLLLITIIMYNNKKTKQHPTLLHISIRSKNPITNW